jgi:hypothetical protein
MDLSKHAQSFETTGPFLCSIILDQSKIVNFHSDLVSGINHFRYPLVYIYIYIWYTALQKLEQTVHEYGTLLHHEVAYVVLSG